MRLKEKNLYSAPKRPARTRLYGSIQGTAQIGSLEKSYKLRNYTAYIQKTKMKMKYCVCTMGDGMRTILQVNKCSGVLRQILFGKGLSESKKSLWILGFSATSIKIRHRLFKSWITLSTR